MMTSLKYILLFLVATFIPCNSQILGIDILQGRDRLEIPFDYIGGFILVDILVEGKFNMNFIYDTGASNTILFDRNIGDFNNQPPSDTISITGADISDRLEGYIYRNLSFQFSGLEYHIYRDIVVLSKVKNDFEKIVGYKIDGIVSPNFFKRLTTKIDFVRNRLILYNPSFRSFHRGYQNFEANIVNGKPYMNCNVDFGQSKSNLIFLIDTGANISAIIHQNTDSTIVVDSSLVDGYLGRGLSGNIMGHIGVINSLELGSSFKFNSMITYFQNVELNSNDVNLYRNGIIGTNLLRKFYIIIDYVKSTIYLKPNKYFDDDIEIDKSGLIVHVMGENLNKFVIHYVYQGGPGDLCGLMKGDTIIKLGRCKSKFLSMDKISKKFQKKEGKTYDILIQRENQKLKTRLSLIHPLQ